MSPAGPVPPYAGRVCRPPIRRCSARRPHCGPPVDTCCRTSAGYAIMQLASGLSVTLVRRRHVDLGRLASAICCCAL
ncbi:putative leader peptide [Streptomyces sp. NPDC054842]